MGVSGQSHIIGSMGESAGLDTRNVMGGWGTRNNQHLEPGRLSSYLQGPTSSFKQQLCSSTKPREGYSLAKELSRAQVCLIGGPQTAFLSLEPGLPPYAAQAEELSHSPAHC